MTSSSSIQPPRAERRGNRRLGQWEPTIKGSLDDFTETLLMYEFE